MKMRYEKPKANIELLEEAVDILTMSVKDEELGGDGSGTTFPTIPSVP